MIAPNHDAREFSTLLALCEGNLDDWWILVTEGQ